MENKILNSIIKDIDNMDEKDLDKLEEESKEMEKSYKKEKFNINHSKSEQDYNLYCNLIDMGIM